LHKLLYFTMTISTHSLNCHGNSKFDWRVVVNKYDFNTEQRKVFAITWLNYLLTSIIQIGYKLDACWFLSISRPIPWVTILLVQWRCYKFGEKN